MIKLGIEKRTKVLYARVTPTNKKWITAEANRVGMTEAEIVDFIICAKREADASHNSKPAKHPRKT